MIDSKTHNQEMDWFHKLFTLWEQGLNGHKDHPLVQFRKQGYLELQNSSFPTRRDEDWKYTSLNRLLNVPYQQYNNYEAIPDQLDDPGIPNVDGYKIVLYNGLLVSKLSDVDLPKGVALLPVAEALQNESWKNWIEGITNEQGGTGKNTFIPLNRAFADHGIVIGIDKNVALEEPIQIIHMADEVDQPFFTNPQLFIRAERGSQITIIDHYITRKSEATYFNNAGVWIDLEENARVSHYKINQESKSAFQIHNSFVRQQRDSHFYSMVVDLGGRIVRNNLSTSLKDSNTTTDLFGCYLGTQDQHIDNQTFIDHAVPYCESNELYKGILKDRARGVFNGKVMVRQDAQKTNAFQQNNSLVLSPNAVMDAKPQLEIFADDVRCSHGATIGQLDESAIFYLRSRGLSDLEARKILQVGFLGEVINSVRIEGIREAVMNWIDEKLSE